MTYYPQSPTNWTESLEKIYARQSRQLEEHHANLRQRDKQMVDATIGADKISKAISDLGSISKTAKAIADKQDAKKTTKLRTEIEALPLDQQERIEQLALEKSIDGEHTTLKQRLQSDELIPNEIKQTILNLSGGKSLRLKKILASDRVENSISLINEKLDNDPDLQLSYDTAKESGKLKSWYRNQSRELLKDINLNDRYISTHFESSIEAAANTKGVLAGIQYGEVALTQDNLISEKLVKATQFSIENNPNGFAELIQLEIQEGVDPSKGIDIAQSKEKLTLKYYRLAKARKLTTDDIIAMKAGKIEGHPSGDTGAILLSDDQWLKIQSGVNEADAEFLAKKTTQRDSSLIAGTVEYLRTGDENKKQEVLAAYLTAGGKETDEAFVELDNSRFSFQSQDAYKAAVQNTTKIISAGRSSSYDTAISSTQNVQRKRELEKDKKAYQLNREDNGLDKDNADKIATNYIDTRNQLNLAPGGKVPAGSPTIAMNVLSRNYDRIYKEVYDEIGDPTSTAVKAEADRRFDSFITTLGFKDDGINGMLTPDVNGRFPALEAWYNGRKEFQSGDLPTISAGEITRSWNELQGVKSVKRLLQKKGAALNNAEIVSFTNFCWNADKGTVTRWSPDILLKSELLGVMPSTLVKMQLEALIASEDPDDKAIVQNLGLEDIVDKIPTADVKLRKYLENHNALHLLSKYEYQGIRGLTPKDKIQIARLESIVSQSGEKLTKNIRDNKIKAGKQLDKKRNAQQALDTFNKQFPKSNFTRKDIKWDDELKTWVLITE